MLTYLPMDGTSFFWKVNGLSSPDLYWERREERVTPLVGLQTARPCGACRRIPTRGFFAGDTLALSPSFLSHFFFDGVEVSGGVTEGVSCAPGGVSTGIGSGARKREW